MSPFLIFLASCAKLASERFRLENEIAALTKNLGKNMPAWVRESMGERRKEMRKDLELVCARAKVLEEQG